MAPLYCPFDVSKERPRASKLWPKQKSNEAPVLNISFSRCTYIPISLNRRGKDLVQWLEHQVFLLDHMSSTDGSAPKDVTKNGS